MIWRSDALINFVALIAAFGGVFFVYCLWRVWVIGLPWGDRLRWFGLAVGYYATLAVVILGVGGGSISDDGRERRLPNCSSGETVIGVPCTNG